MDTEIVKELLRQYGLTAAFLAFIVSIVVSGVIGAGFFYVNQRTKTKFDKDFAEYNATRVKEAENITQAKWEMKYKACLDALDIVDANLSHRLKLAGGKKPVSEPVDTIRARKCQSNLMLTCENPEVTQFFLRIIFEKDVTVPKIIGYLNALRNAIRKELGFGKNNEFGLDNNWFFWLEGDPRVNSEK